MVFNSGFDNTLWLILSSDNKYRFDMAEFIYDMPKDLYDSICNQLREYDNNSDLEDSGVIHIRKAIMDNNGLNSYYCIEISPGEIKINLKRWNSVSDRLNEEIELVLYSWSRDNMDDNYFCYLGKYSFNSSRFLSPFGSLLTFVGDSREYEIYDSNDSIVNISMSLDGEMNKKVNLKLMPKELVLNDLGNRRSVKKLVRGRK